MRIGIIGGTGPAGRGLAVRSAAAGHEVIIGSRDAGRAQEVAEGLSGQAEGSQGSITGGTNDDAAQQDLVVIATPWDGAVATVKPLAEALSGRVVVSMVNALTKEGREMLPLYPPRGSMAAQISAALPGSSVAASFHHLPAKQMEDLSSGLEADVLVCGDSDPARALTIELIDSITGLRGIDAGSLAQASPIEAFTAVCITLNIRHRAHSTVRIAGL
ncbi:MAG: NADPH-dependent F420 reductase [Actinomycetes bacterium]